MNSTFYKRLLGTGALLGAIGVMFGAFGAHFLKSRLETSDLEIIHTGVLYLFVHVLILLIIVVIGRDEIQSRVLKSAGAFFAFGIILFSGSLFLIGTKSLTGIDSSFIGVLTPIGGLCMITGWILMFVFSINAK